MTYIRGTGVQGRQEGCDKLNMWLHAIGLRMGSGGELEGG